MRSARTLTATVLGFAVLAASCGGDAAPTTTTTTTTRPSTTTTSTTLPPEAAFVVASQGEDSPVVRAVQFLLVCNGYENTVVDGRDETLVPDGQYGAITATVVDRVQRDLGLPRDGSRVDARLYEALDANCDNTRSVYLSENRMSIDGGGYAAPDYPDSWTFYAVPEQRVTLTSESGPITMGLYNPDGTELVAVAETEGFSADIQFAGSHTVRVNSDEPVNYIVNVGLPPHWSVLLLQSTGLDLVDFGDSPEYVIETVGAILGGSANDTGWNEAGGGCVRWRRVEWGDGELWLYFTDAGADALEESTFRNEGIAHFAQWRMNLPPSGVSTLPALQTPSGLRLGVSEADVVDVYGDRVAIDGAAVSIVDGIIIGELSEDGVLQWLSSGATLCVPEDENGESEEEGEDEG